MKIEATLLGQDLSRSGEEAKRLEDAGVDAVYVLHGPFECDDVSTVIAHDALGLTR